MCEFPVCIWKGLDRWWRVWDSSCCEFVISLCTAWQLTVCLKLLVAAGGAWSHMVLLNCLIRIAEFHACSSLSVCLILWGSNVAYISSTSHCVLYVSVSLSHSLTLCFSILCIGLSLWACVHAHVQICEYVLYVFISLHNLESSSLCFSPKDLPA